MIELMPNAVAAYDLMHNGTLALAKAERQGMCFDEKYALKQKKLLTKKINNLEKEFKSSEFFRRWQRSVKSEVNIYSNTQLGTFLYNVEKIKPASKTKKSDKGSTTEDALASLGIPELDILLKIRKLKKLRDTYLESFIRENNDGVIHPVFNLNFVVTYRSSASDPNFQNIPKREKEAMTITRNCLIPRKGHQLMEVDFGQLEVRIAACYHNDPTMLKYLRDPTTDMHRDIAMQVFKLSKYDKANSTHSTLRKAAKNGFVFPQFYGDYFKPCAINMGHKWCRLPNGKWKKGQGPELKPGYHLSDHMISKGIRSMDDFISHIKTIEAHFWNKRFPVYKEWKTKHWELYQKNGFVDLLTGFRCRGVMSENDAINYPIQGAAFHCLLWSYIRIDSILEQKKLKSKLIGQIHDAIVLDVHPDEVVQVMTICKQVMTVDLPNTWKWINVPMEVEFDLGEVDVSWASLKTVAF